MLTLGITSWRHGVKKQLMALCVHSFIHNTTEDIHLLLLQPSRKHGVTHSSKCIGAGTEHIYQTETTCRNLHCDGLSCCSLWYSLSNSGSNMYNWISCVVTLESVACFLKCLCVYQQLQNTIIHSLNDGIQTVFSPVVH